MSTIAIYAATLKQAADLQAENVDLRAENAKLRAENERLRAEYQAVSSMARRLTLASPLLELPPA